MFSSGQTYELMNCLEEISLTLKLDQSTDPKGQGDIKVSGYFMIINIFDVDSYIHGVW